MRRCIILIVLISCLSAWFILAGEGSKDSPQRIGGATTELPVSVSGTVSSLPMSFEPNLGQFPAAIRFASIGPAYALFLKSSGFKLRLRNDGNSEAVSLEVAFPGANQSAEIRGVGRLSSETNYFRGEPKHWITHVPAYEKVIVENVYPGIDVAYYGKENRFEYDFIVEPGATPDSIDVLLKGASYVALTDQGDLTIHIGNQKILLSKPVLYQDIQGRRVFVDGRYDVRAHDRVGFKTGAYDRAVPLVIDPQLVYSIYGAAMTRVYGIGRDAAGNLYVCGTTPDLGPNDQATDAYVAKLNAAGSALLWSNHFGSLGYSDSATAIAVDRFGKTYVTGWTTYFTGPSLPKFPTTPNAIQTAFAGIDAFLTKFDANGNMLYSTLLGGRGRDAAAAVAVDSLGNTFVAGQTDSADFPTSKAFQGWRRGNSDGFVSVINPQGSAFVYSTYIGGGGEDAATGIAADAGGNAYLTGFTTSTDFPVANPIRPASSGGADAFVLKFNAAGSSLVYGTYLGGSSDDGAWSVAIDSSNNAYVAGTTKSTNFPTVSAYQPVLRGGTDAFVTKVNSNGSAFLYSTYLGGSANETVDPIWCDEKPSCSIAIAVNRNGNAVVTGITKSPNFPQLRSLQTFKGTSDAFVTAFSPDGASLVYSTLLGGSTSVDRSGLPASSGTAVFTDGDSNVFLAGLTNTSDFPITANPTNGPCCVNQVWNGIGTFLAKLTDAPDATPPDKAWMRVEQDNASVSYAGTWYIDRHSFNSRGSAFDSMEARSRAKFTFNGTAVRWIGYKDAWSGIANVYLDGVLKAQVDGYSATDHAQAALYTITGLGSGLHTLTVEVTGTRNASSRGLWVWVDAFDYVSGS
jgi:hypothetical protein